MTEARDRSVYPPASFKEFLSKPISPDLIKNRLNYYKEIVRSRQEAMSSLSEKETKYFQATGEYPLKTPYDALPDDPKLLPTDQVAETLTVRHCDAETLLHPERIKSLKNAEEKGFVPVTDKDIPVLDRCLEEREAVIFSDFGFSSELQKEGKGVEDSANILLARGLWSWTSDRMPTIPYVLSSTPDVVSAEALETMALIQGFGFIPVDSIWNKPDNQVLMAERAFQLLENEPVLFNHPDKEYLSRRSKRLIGATLKANPEDAKKRAKTLYDHGVRLFRVYDPRSLGRMTDTVKAVRDIIGNDGVVFSGQVIDPEQAYRLKEAGANGLIVGIGEGGICETPGEAGLAVKNMLDGYQIIRSGVGIPVIFDAGVGRQTPIAIGVGAAGVMKSQAIGRGIEKPPFMYWLQTEEGLASLYSGEAAPRTKYLGGKLDRLGRPLFPEGADEYVIFNKDLPSIASYILRLSESLATALVFRHKTLEELQHERTVELWRKSSGASENGSVHHKR